MSINLVEGPILVVATAVKGRGSGHLRRSGRLVQALRARGLSAFLWIHDRDQMGELAELCSLSGLSLSALASLLLEGVPEGSAWRFIVCDVFRCSSRLFTRLSALGPLIGIDEGGNRRASFDWLIDLLPRPRVRHRANEIRPDLAVEQVEPRDKAPETGIETAQVLVSFGGEDPEGLSFKALQILCEQAGFLPEHIFLLLPPAMRDERARRLASEARRRGVSILEPTAGLGRLLHHYDLAVTQYGLTALEALRSGAAVWTMAPKAVHRSLARSIGLPGHETGYDLGGEGALARIARRSAELAGELFAACEAGAAAGVPEGGMAGSAGLAALLEGATFPAGITCPVCRYRSTGAVLARFPGRTYRRCPRCKIVHMVRSGPPPIVYDRDYFFDEYRAQYGKTYLEDFPALRAMAASRLAIIQKLLPPARRTTLDIGCAYGPFLAEASERGFEPCGIDASADAVAWVRGELGLSAVEGLFPDIDLDASFGRRQFDLVSLWYVIEHAPDLDSFLVALSRTVSPGGILAFSTPSYAGISARSSRTRFLKASPEDHWTVLDPRTMRRLLARYGFALEKIRVTGHHPQRFPRTASCVPGSRLWRMLAGFSRLFGLGDTFEVYARRIGTGSE